MGTFLLHSSVREVDKYKSTASGEGQMTIVKSMLKLLAH
jgi:hypothetical protein